MDKITDAEMVAAIERMAHIKPEDIEEIACQDAELESYILVNVPDRPEGARLPASKLVKGFRLEISDTTEEIPAFIASDPEAIGCIVRRHDGGRVTYEALKMQLGDGHIAPPDSTGEI